MSIPSEQAPAAGVLPLYGIAGWFGKLPCLGDFATRRLPSDFIEAWDAWLQRSLAASRRQLGEAWLDTFLTSPMWRFILAPGVCGEEAYTGLMLPSVDKVGRYFPLTLALPLAAAHAHLPALMREQVWYSELERVGLAALTIDFSPDALELALSENPLALQRHDADAANERALHDCLRGPGGAPQCFHVADVATLPPAIEATARAIVAEHASGKSYWWSVDHDSGATELHCSPGLPPEDYFSVLLGGAAAAAAMPLDPLEALGAGPAR